MPTNNEKNVQKFYDALSKAFQNIPLEDDTIRHLSSRLAVDAVRNEKRSGQDLVSVKHIKGEVPKVVYYSPGAAIKAIAHAIAAVAHPTNYLLLGAAALGCGVALRDIRHEVTPAEASLFCLIYYSDGSRISRETALNIFDAYCKDYSEVKSEDFASALQSLLKGKFISEEKDTLRVAQRVYLSTIAPIF